MNFKKLLSLISGLSLPAIMLTTTISCAKNSDNSNVDFGIKGDIIKTANYILEDKINDSYIMNYMEGLVNKAPTGVEPLDLNTFLEMKPLKIQQISLKNDEDPINKFKISSNFDNANLNLLDSSTDYWYGVAAEIAVIKYVTDKQNETEIIVRLRDSTYKKWDNYDSSISGKAAKWHDGVIVKAQDFVFTFESILNLENNSKQVENIKESKISNTQKILDAQIKDKKTFKEAMENYSLGIKALSDNILYFKFDTPGGKLEKTDNFVNMILKIVFMPAREDFIKKLGGGNIQKGLKKFGSNKSTMLGNGAFYPFFVMFDYESIFKKSDYYWDKERIPANSYKWKVVKDAATLGVLFKSKQISQAYGILPEIYKELRNDNELKKYTYQGLDNDPIGTLLTFNFNSKNAETKKALQNIHFRRALGAAINRTDVIVAKGTDGSLPSETSSSLSYRNTDKNGCAFKEWLVNDDGTAKYKLNFCDNKNKIYELPLATKKYNQQVFYEKSDLHIDFTDKLHNLEVVNYEIEKFEKSFPLKKPIEINLVYNSTDIKNRNAAEMITQQLEQYIKKNVVKVNLIGKEQNSFLDAFRTGKYDLALLDEITTKHINEKGFVSTFIFVIFKNMLKTSDDNRFNNITGTWTLWEEIISKDPLIENNADDGSGWGTKIANSTGLKIENNTKLTKNIFMTNDDIELLRWYFAKTKDGNSWIDTEMTNELYNDLVSTHAGKLNQDVFKKYFVNYNNVDSSSTKFKKVSEPWKNEGMLCFQFRAGRILEVLLRYYQPIINLTGSSCTYDASNLIGFTYSPWNGFMYAYTGEMVKDGKLKNFKYKLPTDCHSNPDMWAKKGGK